MGKSSNPSPQQLAASSLYRWYQGNASAEQAARHMHQWIASEFTDVSISAQTLLITFARMSEQKSFHRAKEQLLRHWKAPMEAANSEPDEELARQFLDAVIKSLDHGSLIVPHISAGMTHIKQGEFGDVRNYLTGEREHWILHLTTRGSALYTTDCDLEVSSGSLVLIKPSAQCYYQRHPESTEWCHSFVLFKPRSDLSQWLHWQEISEGLLFQTILHTALLKKVENILSEIRLLSNEETNNLHELCINLMEQLFIRVSIDGNHQDKKTEDMRVKRACDFLRDDPTFAVSVEMVAQHCHISPSRLSHLFKDAMGIGIKQFQTRLRMQLARKLLTTTDQAIETIALSTGYNDPAQFSKYFRKQHGCNPREFRRQHT